jgi:hypothetical protein
MPVPLHRDGGALHHHKSEKLRKLGKIAICVDQHDSSDSVNSADGNADKSTIDDACVVLAGEKT